ncbi:TIGR02680 family protein [Tsukamurella sp. PLM1]|uniref:TIGR02680 family protein n=1 Tax=Tsukamurella sp. PLM1 TaxID=2929795 RepID=UPI002064429E|nr:TIGR02680 family protein [Tsukamurella sp. PLM1]BDH57950.1 hypothetical protein MTP03_28890 [Tsukamurella sp. PLM1]
MISSGSDSVLPVPQDARWKPLRAGLLDVFYYDAQEFWFRDGRLLLRGNNGAGKSKVLALTLPFLLDGDLAPYRVEPDADPKKRMEWNLLLGGEHPHPERIGYTWLEFGRIDEAGAARYCTIGCGLKAVTGKGIAAHWFFVSPERVGEGLHLADDNGTPLTRDRLGDAISGSGRRYDRAKEYRAAVDEALFGLGELRYAALVDLLIRLRQPQLSKKPSEKALSAALTESLPPLGQAVLADVAEAFRSLEEDRDELAAMSEAHDAAAAFLDHYRRYAGVASRRYAAKPRAAHSKYEHVGRELAESERRLAEAAVQRDAGRTELDEVERERVRLTAHEAALRGSEAMEAATLLDGARQRADMLADASRQADAARVAASATTADRRARVDRARAGLAEADWGLARAREAATDAAAGAALHAQHHDTLDAVLVTSDIGELRRTAAELVTMQSRAIKHVNALSTEVDRHAAAVAAARTRVGELDASICEIAEVRVAAEDRVRETAAALVSGAREHHRSAAELVIHDVDAVLDELAPWAAALSGENPYTVAVTACAADVRDAITRADATAEAAETAERDALAELDAERERLESGQVEAPAPRHTVDPDRRGARLWQLVDFAPDLSDEERAGLEAALEASGALDATVGADGVLAGSDVIATAGRAAPGSTLATVLRAAADPEDPAASAVPAATVEAVLRAIALGPESKHHTWMATDGTFRVGTLTGAGASPTPSTSARARANRHAAAGSPNSRTRSPPPACASTRSRPGGRRSASAATSWTPNSPRSRRNTTSGPPTRASRPPSTASCSCGTSTRPPPPLWTAPPPPTATRPRRSTGTPPMPHSPPNATPSTRSGTPSATTAKPSRSCGRDSMRPAPPPRGSRTSAANSRTPPNWRPNGRRTRTSAGAIPSARARSSRPWRRASGPTSLSSWRS